MGGISLSEIENISKVETKSAAEFTSQQSSINDKKNIK